MGDSDILVPWTRDYNRTPMDFLRTHHPRREHRVNGVEVRVEEKERIAQ